MRSMEIRNSIGNGIAYTALGALGVIALCAMWYLPDLDAPMAWAMVGPVAALFPVGVVKLIDRRVQLEVNPEGVYNSQWPVKPLHWKEIERIESKLVRDNERADSGGRNYVCLVLRPDSDVLNIDGIKTFALSDETPEVLRLDNTHWNITYQELLEKLTEYHAQYA